MTDGVAVRQAGIGDSDDLARLDAASFDAPWSADAVRALLQDGLTRAWVARVGEGLAGAAIVRVVAGEPRMLHLHTEDDLYYIQNYSFWLDLRILLKTVVVVWQGHGAY